MKPYGLASITAGLLLSHAITGQATPPSIQGVWQTVEVIMPGPTGRTITIPEPRHNLTIVMARHYSRVQVEAEEPRPVIADVAKATADELRAAWGPFAAEAGTYEVTGHLITMRPIAAKNAAVMAPGAFTTWSYKLEGGTLWVTAERNQDGSIANPVTVKSVRLE